MNNYNNKGLGEEPSLTLSSPRPPSFPSEKKKKIKEDVNKKELLIVAPSLLELKGTCPSFFENLPTLLKPEQVTSIFGFSIKTIYDWRYRGKQRKFPIPGNLFVKFNKNIFIRTEVLKAWITLQNPSM